MLGGGIVFVMLGRLLFGNWGFGPLTRYRRVIGGRECLVFNGVVAAGLAPVLCRVLSVTVGLPSIGSLRVWLSVCRGILGSEEVLEVLCELHGLVDGRVRHLLVFFVLVGWLNPARGPLYDPHLLSNPHGDATSTTLALFTTTTG